MNRPHDRVARIPDLAIDRLVDGELSGAERRDLLLKLDENPEAWRRCALAFLEDQAWRAALAGSKVPEIVRPATIGPKASPRRPWLLARSAVAASLVAATFAAGFAAGGASRGRPNPTVVAVIPPEKAAPAPEVVEESIRNVGWIDLVDRSAGEAPPQRLPVLAGPGLDEDWLREQPSPVPDYVRAQWERRGFQVEERRRLVPVALQDGRRVSIPVDEVALQYIGPEPL